MSKDIIADSQTAVAVSKLRRGEATDSLRDEVSAALLTAVQKMLVELEEMKKCLWSTASLKSFVDDRHAALCANCPTREWVEQRKTEEKTAASLKATESKGGWFTEVLKSESIRYFLLILLLVWAIIYVKTGSDGVKAVKSAVTHSLTGGQAR